MIEVSEMKKKWDSMMKATLLTALVAMLVMCVSCRQEEPVPTPPPEPTTSTQQPATATPAAAVQPATQQEAPKPAAAAPAAEPAAPAVPAGYAPLNIELPKPMFVGTPQDMTVENLEKPLGRPRPPFMAPAGAVNLALNKPVSASDEEPIIGELYMITDGDKEAADGSYVELGPFVQHVTIDLEQECELYAIVVWHYHKQPRVYFDVVAQVSNDKDFITDVKTVFNNDIDNSAGLGIGTDMHYVETNEGRLIDLISQGSPRARYVRLYSNGNTSNDLNHYIEIEVFGKPVK
jgi:hypothetical protein